MNMNSTVKRKINFVNSSQNQGIVLSFERFGSISWYTLFGFHPMLFQFSQFFFSRISSFFDLSITEETWVVEMRIWCIKIVNVKSKFCKFISTRRKTSILRRIWLNFTALRLVLIRGSFSFHNFFPGFQTFSTWASLKRLE
jgi:hypothetical protein